MHGMKTDRLSFLPSPWGAHSWQSMSYNPQTGLVYIPVLHSAAKFSDEGVDLEHFQAVDFSGGIGCGMLTADYSTRDYPLRYKPGIR